MRLTRILYDELSKLRNVRRRRDDSIYPNM